MIESFHQPLWESWLDSTLSWSLFDFSIAPVADSEQNQKWHECGQEWIFQDPNLFYYPLFGLGNLKSKIAFVATGPGHNVEEDMEEYVDTPATAKQSKDPHNGTIK